MISLNKQTYLSISMKIYLFIRIPMIRFTLNIIHQLRYIQFIDMGGGVAAINLSVAMSGVESTLALMNTAAAIANIAKTNKLHKEVQKYNKQYQIMNHFRPILQSFQLISPITSQNDLNIAQSINNWNMIARNLQSLSKIGINLIQKYPHVNPPTVGAKTWIGLTIILMFTSVQIVSNILQIKNRKENIAKFKEEFNKKQANIETDSQTKHRKDEVKTKTKGNEGGMIEESGNTGKESRTVAKKEGNMRRLWNKTQNLKWSSILGGTLRVVAAAAAIYSFVTTVIGLAQLQSQILRYQEMLKFDGQVQKDQQYLADLLDAVSQDMYTISICSYIGIQDLQQSFILLAQQSPFDSKVLKDLAIKFNPEKLVQGFNRKKISELSDFTTKVNKLSIDYKEFKKKSDKSEQDKKNQLLKTLDTMYSEFIKFEPAPPKQGSTSTVTSISSIFVQVASQISKNLPFTSLITTDMQKKSTFNDGFLNSIEAKFVQRQKKMAKVDGLEARLKSNSLVETDRSQLKKIDNSTFKNIMVDYYSFIFNINKPDDQQVQASQIYDDDEFQEILKTLDEKVKQDLVFQIQKRCERFFFDDTEGDLKLIGNKVLGIEFEKGGESYENIYMKALPNLLFISEDMTIFESQAELRQILKTKQPSVPDFKPDQIDKINRVIWIVVNEKTSDLQNQQTGKTEKVTFRPLVYWKGLLLKTKDENPTYYRLYAKDLFSIQWTFEKYYVTDNPPAGK